MYYALHIIICALRVPLTDRAGKWWVLNSVRRKWLRWSEKARSCCQNSDREITHQLAEPLNEQNFWLRLYMDVQSSERKIHMSCLRTSQSYTLIFLSCITFFPSNWPAVDILKFYWPRKLNRVTYRYCARSWRTRNTSHLWTSLAFRACISLITFSVFMQSFLIQGHHPSLEIPHRPHTHNVWLTEKLVKHSQVGQMLVD